MLLFLHLVIAIYFHTVRLGPENIPLNRIHLSKI